MMAKRKGGDEAFAGKETPGEERAEEREIKRYGIKLAMKRHGKRGKRRSRRSMRR
jgi:hypothetical protein